ncbi:MAG: DUF2726 domain-containing protein [Sphingopyxis sp.]|uniref:DUF2726 domain-containing protein n=1 Tax=Sphingopyxis sp. TaxID=1908224 RepID=UPI002AB85546|nr:DUF2726 domain-containing protein [Sphingopyxis sp.]MDZ3830760.1 DUF2726 domain-containing protein [Sphingopyxis sp.]
MPPEIQALIDKPLLLALVLAIGAVCGVAAERVGENLNKAERRRRWQRRKSGGGKWGASVRPDPRFRADPAAARSPSPVATAAEQLRAVMEAEFQARPLLNAGERRLLSVLDKALAEESPGWRAMGQVSLGEILASPDEAAFLAVNSKRVDLLIIDADCRPLHAVEMQGKGHHKSDNTAARDAVKREALRRAGIGYVEVVSGDTPAEVRAMVRKLVGRPHSSSSPRT